MRATIAYSGNLGAPKEGNKRRLKAWQKVWENSSERRGVGGESASCPQLKYMGVLRRIGELERQMSFMSLLVHSSFCSSLDDLFWKCIRRSSYTGTEEESRTTVSYTSLYFILDKYHYYSKASSPGVNELYVFWNRFTCKVILILIQPQERNLWSQPSKSFINNKVDTWDGHAYDYLLEERLQCATRTEGMLFSR